MPEQVSVYLQGLRDVFSHHLLFGVGVLLMGSFFFGRASERLRLPAVTGFILAGLLLGPSFLGFVHGDLKATLVSVTEMALALIAFVIGSEFTGGKLRSIGRPVLVITMFQLLGTFILVTAGLLLAGMAPGPSAVLGAVATATAPAATVAIVRDLRARGPFVDHLYGVVALDDAGCILLFAVVTALAAPAAGGGSGLAVSILAAFREIFVSILAGGLTGWLLHVMTRGRARINEMLIISLSVILLLSAVSAVFHLSALLASMTAGAVLANLSRKAHRIIDSLDSLSPPLYAAFFAIAGTELDLRVLSSPSILLLGGIFVVARAAGKLAGVNLGARAARSDPLIRKYLGLGMIPQAGVAIGLVLFLQTIPYFASEPELTSTLINIVLFSVLFNELAGPPLSRYSVVKGASLE